LGIIDFAYSVVYGRKKALTRKNKQLQTVIDNIELEKGIATKKQDIIRKRRELEDEVKHLDKLENKND
jgi:hypothetical protein